MDLDTKTGIASFKTKNILYDKLIREKTNNRCYVTKVECAEHGANSAIVEKEENNASKV